MDELNEEETTLLLARVADDPESVILEQLALSADDPELVDEDLVQAAGVFLICQTLMQAGVSAEDAAAAFSDPERPYTLSFENGPDGLKVNASFADGESMLN